MIKLVLIWLLTSLTMLTLACIGTEFFVPDATCSDNGYCVNDFCSCSPGFSDTTCSTNDYIDTCTPFAVSPESSNFAVTIDAAIVGGVLNLDVLLPVEDSTSANRATFTSIDFSSCDYPASGLWSRSTDGACLEYFSFEDSVVDSMSCFDESCFDALDEPLSCLDSSACENAPCRKKYTSVLTISRGYIKESGRVSTEGTDTSRHGITITYPWVMEAEATSIDVVSIPNVSSNFIIESVTYSGGYWLFTIQTSVLYPWRLNDGIIDLNFATDNHVTVASVSMVVVSCALDAAECTQTITVSVLGCSTLENPTTFTSTGLIYTCNAVACPNPDAHDASLVFSFDGTDSCETVELNVTVVLNMRSYDPDLTTSRSSFIFGSNSQPINFKISVQSESGDSVTGITLMDFVSDAVLSGPYTVTDLNANPHCLSTESCFSVDSNDIGGTSDDVEAIQDINFTATVELTFSRGAKRTLNLYSVTTSATLILSEEAETSESYTTKLIAIWLFPIFWF